MLAGFCLCNGNYNMDNTTSALALLFAYGKKSPFSILASGYVSYIMRSRVCHICCGIIWNIIKHDVHSCQSHFITWLSNFWIGHTFLYENNVSWLDDGGSGFCAHRTRSISGEMSWQPWRHHLRCVSVETAAGLEWTLKCVINSVGGHSTDLIRGFDI